MKTNAEYQAAHRLRVANRLLVADRMQGALADIIARIGDNEKPLAVELRDIAQRGLGETK